MQQAPLPCLAKLQRKDAWAKPAAGFPTPIPRAGQNHTFVGTYGVYTVFLAGKAPYIRPYTVWIYGSGQPYPYPIAALLSENAKKGGMRKTGSGLPYSCTRFLLCLEKMQR